MYIEISFGSFGRVGVSMKVCPNCNAEYEDEMSFCFRCGEKLHQKVNDTVLIRQRKKFVFWSYDNFFSYTGRCGR